MLNRTSIFATVLLAGALIQTLPMFGQEQQPAGPPPEPEAQAQEPAPPPEPAPAPGGGWRKFGEPRRQRSQGGPADYSYRGQVPGQLVLPAGTWITLRVNQPLSSDHNAPGDAFSATLTQPLIVSGFVVARRGQIVEGRVSEAVKAGRAKGTSRLGLEITELSLVDGQQIPLRSQLMEFAGGTSKGRDAAAIVGTTGVGAAIGGAAAGGFGAGMGAIAGAAASTVGVLATRGHATEVYPETPVTFRTLEPVTINTERSAQAFQAVRQTDYEPNHQLQRRTVQQVVPAVSPWWYSGYGYGYPYYYPGYYWGPSVGFYFGGRGYYRGGWGRHWR